MKRSLVNFVCQECGYDSPAFLGKCPECGSWSSFKEIRLGSLSTPVKQGNSSFQSSVPKTLSQIHYQEKQRTKTGFSEMDGVLGGGIVGGSVILLAGDPGVGKSTLLLQTALNLSTAQKTVLYISGEESEEQIKLRADRIQKTKNNNLLLLSLSDTDAIVSVISEIKPSLVVIDSIQTMESQNAGGLSGAVGQVRYAASQFIKTAKTLNIPLVIVGHVTKEGMVAGPMILSHMVDVVLFLEGEKTTRNRILRSLKNRFGPVDEVGVFVMDEKGIEEANPHDLFVSEHNNSSPGSVLTVTLEGTRAFLLEIQSLVVFSKLPMPRRVAIGFDPRRLELLLAVLQKHTRLPVETMDVFVNVAGGIKITDPASDLGICLAIFSSLKNKRIVKTVAIGEVGLLGEVRQVPDLLKRMKEAQKLGFKTIVSAKSHKTLLDVVQSVQ